MGRFYVLGAPPFEVLFVPDLIDKTREGYIMIDSAIINNFPNGMARPHMYNSLLKLMNDGTTYPALFKSKEMAEEVCFACNRLKLKRPPIIQV